MVKTDPNKIIPVSYAALVKLMKQRDYALKLLRMSLDQLIIEMKSQNH